MAFTDWNVTKFLIYAVIDGIVVEVIEATLDFVLNAIPTCVLNVAIGREVRSLTPSSAHDIIDDLVEQVPAQVYCTAVEGASSLGDSGPVDEWPDGPFLIFDGYVSGTSFNKSRSGGAQLLIYLKHWLVDLTFSSCLTRSTSPFNPGQFNLQAAFQMASGETSFQISTAAAEFFDDDKISEDMWYKSIRPWFEAVCEKDCLAVDEDADAGINTEAIDALDRFEPFEDGYEFGAPLALDFDVLGVDTAIDSIIQDISMESLESLAGTTIWHKLIGQMGEAYMFSLVPLVDTALIVPFTPGQRTEWATIDASEYEAVRMEGETPRPLRGVGVFTGLGSMTGAGSGVQLGRAQDIQELGGFFENPDLFDKTQGMILFRQGPKWISNVVATNTWGEDAAAPNKPKGNAFFPGVGVPPAIENPFVIRKKAKTLWDEYARACYLCEILKGRSGALRGKVRFDINVGSTVAIVCIEEKFVAAALGLAGENIIYGEVRHVTTVLNSESVQGSTCFKIGNLRSELENELEGTSTDDHPLYSSFWNGAPIVGLPEFDHPDG